MHLSDHVLQTIAESNVSCDETEAESHISDCEVCQQRLLELAAGDLRSEIKECLSESRTWMTDAELSSTVIRSEPADPRQLPDFEKAALHQMLSAVLGAARHPETLGSLDRYEIERVIGVGGMGFVVRGYDSELQRPVAIKFILPTLLNNGTVKQRFLREARAAASILHPNVIAIHGLGEQRDVPWFSMPLITGPTLRQLVEANGPLADRDVVRIGRQLASGLAAAHRQGLVHRDIKPENVLIDNHVNRVVLTDFGLARRDCENGLTRTGGLTGTLNFMSPEQVKGDEIDGRSDLFSLGSVLYFLVTGEQPFHADSPMQLMNKIMSESHPDPRTRNPEVTEHVGRVIQKLLQKNPADRFQSAAELEQHLEQLLSHLNNPVLYQPPVLRQRFRIRTRTQALLGWLFPGCLIVVALLLLPVLSNTIKKPLEEPPVAEVSWTQIQQRYGLSSSTEFQREFERLNSDIRKLLQEWPVSAGTGTLQFPDGKLELDLELLNEEFDRMATALSQF